MLSLWKSQRVEGMMQVLLESQLQKPWGEFLTMVLPSRSEIEMKWRAEQGLDWIQLSWTIKDHGYDQVYCPTELIVLSLSLMGEPSLPIYLEVRV